MAKDSQATEQWRAVCAAGRKRPDWWAQRVLGVTLTPDQNRCMRALPHHTRHHWRAAHSTGKTFVDACAVLWYGCCFPNPTIITTAAVGRQVKRQVWGEMPRLFMNARVKLPGQMMAQSWKIPPATPGMEVGAVGYSTDHPDRFTGEHGENVMIVLDEGHGISEQIMLGVKTSLQTESSRVILSGNPTTPEGAFWQEYKSGSWHCDKLDAFTHPNVVHDDPSLFPGAVTRQWIADMARDYGETSAYYIGRVLGEFPEDAVHGMFGGGDIKAAVARYEAGVPRSGQCRMAVDVAGEGADLTVWMVADDNSVLDIDSEQTMDPLTVGDRAIIMAKNWGVKADQIRIDMTGEGHGTVAYLKRKPTWDGVKGIHFGSSPCGDEPERFLNLRAEMYYHAALAINEQRGGAFAFPDHEMLQADLRATSYKFGGKGSQYQILDKKQIKKLTKRSPDFADAFAMLFAPSAEMWIF